MAKPVNARARLAGSGVVACKLADGANTSFAVPEVAELSRVKQEMMTLAFGVERADGLGTLTTWRPALPVVQWCMHKKESP